MSKRNDLVIKLREMGINAVAKDVMKNGVVFEGIMIDNWDGVNPVVYPNDNTTASEVIAMIENESKFKFDSRILSYDYVIEHVKIGMMRSSALDTVMRRPSEFDGIDEYMYVSNGNYGYKIPADYPHDVWEYAKRNTKACTVVKGISEILFGFAMPNELLYVVTNENTYRGAGNIIDKDAIRKKGIGDRFFAMPSSIHEWIIMPYSDDMDPQDISQMVREINGDVVNPEDQLGDRVYILEV